MFNGTYSNPTQDSSRAVLSADEIAAVKKALTDSAVQVGTFALNPKNNPTFTVIGLNQALPEGETMYDETTSEAKTLYTVTNGDADSGIPLTITLTPGRDNYAIDNSSIKMYFQECNKTGEIIETAEKIIIPNENNSTSIKTKPISTQNFAGLKTDKYYRVCVEGADTKGNAVEPDISGVYAFNLAPTNGVIELNVSATPEYVSSDENAYDLNKNLNVSLKFSYTGGEKLYWYREFDSAPADDAESKGQITITGVDKVFPDVIPVSELVGKSSVYYVLKNESGSSYSRPRSVNIRLDNTKPEINSIKCPEASETSENSFRFEGTASDTGSGINSILVTISDVNEPDKKYETTLAGTEKWSLTIIRTSKFKDATEPAYGGVFAKDGRKKITVQAVDGVGLKSEINTLSEKEFDYKATTPDLKLTKYKLYKDGVLKEEKAVSFDLMSLNSNIYIGNYDKYEFELEAADEYGINSVTCSREPAPAEAKPLTVEALNSEKTLWRITESDLPADGQTAEYNYSITVTDKAGIPYNRTNVLKVKIDRKPPKIENIESPGSKSFGDDSLKGSAYNFKGTAVDESPSIGMKAVRYAIKKTESNDVLIWQDATLNGENWSVAIALGDSGLAEGKYTFYVKAVDNADNTSAEKTVDFCVDQEKPKVEVNIFKGTLTTAETARASDGKYVITDADVSNFRFEITSEDANTIKTIKVKNGDKEAIKNFTTSPVTLKSSDLTLFNNLSEEKEYVFEIEVEDGSGKDAINGRTNTVTKTVLFDKHKPEIKIMNGENEADTEKTAKAYWFTGSASSKAYISGIASDVGSGISKMEISFDKGTSWITLPTANEWTYQYPLAGLSENTDADDSCHTINVRITDKAENVNATNGKVYYFRYDSGAPTLSAKIDNDSINASGTGKISGEVYDGANLAANRPVKKLELSATKNGVAYTLPEGSYTSDLPNPLHGNYSYSINGSKLDEGKYIFTVKAIDYAGNEVTKDAEITVDKTNPEISKVTADVDIIPSSDNSVNANGKKWYNKQTMSVAVTANDNAGGSGIDRVEWRTASSDSTLTDDTADWQPLTKKTENNVTTYKGSVVFEDSAAKEGSRLYIRATDKAGNPAKFKTKVSSTDPGIDHIVFNIDTEKPSLSSKFYQVEGGSEKTSGGTIYLAENKKITVYGAFSDSQSGVQTLHYYLGGSDITSSVNTTYYSSTVEFTDKDKISTIFVDANKTTDKNSIKYWKAEFTPTIADNTDVVLVITGKDIAGNESKIDPVFTISKDTTPPEIRRDSINFVTNSADNIVFQKNSKYYVNNKGQTFTLNGIATDNKGLDTVTLKAKNSSGNAITIASTKTGSASTWTFSDIDLSKTKAVEGSPSVALTGRVSLYVELTDLAGNKNTETNQKLEVVFDTEAPKGVHLQDSNGKDIYFRITEYDNDDILDTNSLWNNELDKNAGKKYAKNSWSNKLNLTIRGLFDDGDILKSDGSSYLDTDTERPYVSGVKKIYYKVFNGTEYNNIKSKLENLKDNTNKDSINSELATLVKGSNPIIPQIEEKRVFYTDTSKLIAGSTLDGKLTSEGYIDSTDGTKKHWAKIKSNYKEQLTGTVEGSNYLVIVAEDNVGNYAVDVATLNNGDIYNHYSLNIDTNAPVVTCEQLSSELLSNATDAADENGNPIASKTKHGNISLNGTITEALSGVDSLTIKIDGKTAQTATINNGSWNITLPGSYFKGLSGNIVIKAIATDKAKNESTTTVANVIVDSAAPVVSLNLADNTTVNGKQTLKGTISDSYLTEDPEPGTLELFYTTKAGTATAPDSIDSSAALTADASVTWRKYNATQKHSSSFSFANIDTSKLILSGGTDSTTYIPDETKVYFTVKATDKAGNIGFATPKSFIVDQDTDRPVITFQNLTLSNEVTSGTETTYTAMGPKTTTSDASIWSRNSQLFGTASDDDGVKEIKVLVKSDEDTPEANDTRWSSNKYSNGIWKYTVEDDGYAVIFFKVEDNAGGVFISKAATSLDITTPKICDTSSNYYGYRTGSGVTASANIYASTVYTKFDTENPTIPKVYYTTDETKANAVTSANILEMLTGDSIPDGWAKLSAIGSVYLGGTKKQTLYILYSSKDGNGIKSVKETMGTDSKSINSTAIAAVPFAATTDATICPHIIKFDLSTLTSGQNKVNLEVTDQSGRDKEEEFPVYVDNTSPEVDIKTHSNDNDVYGSLSVSYGGKTQDAHNQAIDKLYFAVTKENTKPAEELFTSDSSILGWTDIKQYTSVMASWSIIFDGGTNTESESSTAYHAPLLNTYMDSLYVGDPLPSTLEANKEVYVWVYAVDSLGNSGYQTAESVKLNVIPQADKPSVSIDYPVNGSTVGGTIRLSGSSAIQADSLSGVWLQIDPNYNGTTFATDWAAQLAAFNTASGETLYNVVDTEISKIGSAIKANGLQSWNLAINTVGELGQISGKNRVVAVKVYAVSTTTKKVSNESLITFTVDPNRPQFSGAGSSSDLLLVNNLENPTKTMKYTQNMWISGKWYLTGSVKHGAGIKTLTIATASSTTGEPLIFEGTEKTVSGITLTKRTGDTYNTGATAKNWDFSIEVGSDTSNAADSNEFTLTAIDNGNGQDNSITVKIHYDNKAPEAFVAKTARGTISASGNEFMQTNKTFALNGTITEADSGLKCIAFYFTRTIGSTTYFIDPMVTKVDDSKPVPYKYRNNYVDVSGTGIELADGLYWRKVTGASVADKTITLKTGDSVPANVRKGSLCKVHNVLYTIKGINGSSITLDDSPAESTSTDVYFALAQVIDNTSIENGETDLYSETSDSMSNGDGDCMQEGISSIGSLYNWQASINSKNIYDGPVTLHFVYYDQAGNHGGDETEYAGKFINNRPRIASVTVCSDYDGNGTYEESEKKTRYIGGYLTVSGSKKAKEATYETVVLSSDFTTSGGAFTTLKDKSAIEIELIGGNGNLYYDYNIGTTLGSDSNVIKGNVTDWTWTEGSETKTAAGYQDNDDYMDIASGENYVKTSHKNIIELPVSDFDNYKGKGIGTGKANTYYIANSTTDAPTWFQYKIWDDTDGLEAFSTTNPSQNVTMQLALAVQIHDEIAPNVVVNKFYWNSSSDNSLYENSTSNGHIELEEDWKESSGYDSSAAEGEYDGDPKVSGKIVFTGYVYDNKRIKNISVHIPKCTTALKDSSVVAVYKDKVWYDSSSDTLPEGETLKKGSMDTDGWSFKIVETGTGLYTPGENGHKVKWILEYNTEKITDIADKDVILTVTAYDDNGTPNSSSDDSKRATSGSADATTHNPSYKMDVVPYITGVTTSLSSLKSNNPSVYARTAKGHYSVKSDETVTFKGFNLGAATELQISTLSTSGEYNFSVNDITALNNKNNNDSKGSYTGTVDLNKNPTGVYATYANFYNRQPNGDNNNLLNDDIYFDVWQITSDAVQPKSGAAVKPVMAINPKTHDVVFAFVNGTLYFSMPNGNTRSYDYWIGGYDFWTSVGMAYDKYGNSYATAAGGDINADRADQFRIMTSRWGHGTLATEGYNDGTNQFRLELIAQRDFEGSGTSYSGYNNFDKERIQSPSIATTASSEATTTVYLAYYDEINDEIRFKWGNFTNTSKADASSGLMGDYYGFGSIVNAKNVNSDYAIYRTAYNSILAGQTERVVKTNGQTTSAKVLTTDGEAVYAGKYVSIAALEGKGTDDDAVVAVWWDGTHNKLLYSYNKTPKSITAGKYLQKDTGWSKPEPVFGSKIGEYCKVVADANGGIHIAGYDGSNGDVWYAYLDSFDTPSNMKTCIVDSYGIIGTELSIDVALDDNSKPVPYISYYSASRPKIARWVNTTALSSSTLARGAIEDAFTGAWEVSYIPTSSKFSNSNIGVGVWKDSAGKLNYSTTDGEEPTTTNIGTNSFTAGQAAGTESYGTVWGNGTKNEILGYAITSGGSGYIETAQMK